MDAETKYNKEILHDDNVLQDYSILYHKKNDNLHFLYYTPFSLYSNMIAEINLIFVLPAAYLNKITQRLQRRGPREQ